MGLHFRQTAERRNENKMLATDELEKIVTPFCKKYGVKRLQLIGSYAQGVATKKSDIDFLVEFEEPFDNASDRYFGLLHALEDSLHLSVDLLTTSGLTNPFVKESIMTRRKVSLYE